MSRNNTGNPLGSKAFLDFEDNVKNLDEAVNSEEVQWLDRFGRPRLPLMEQERQFLSDQDRREGEFELSQTQREDAFVTAQDSRETRFNDFIASSGYQFAGEYAAGIEITQYNQILRDENGEFWRVSGQVDLPYTTTGDGLPEDSSLTPLGDAVLRQQLAGPINGGDLVGFKALGQGSVARTVKDKLQDTISFFDFIPPHHVDDITNGTSSYDCTSDIQRAIDAAPEGARLLGGNGTFNLSSVTVSKSLTLDLRGCRFMVLETEDEAGILATEDCQSLTIYGGELWYLGSRYFGTVSEGSPEWWINKTKGPSKSGIIARAKNVSLTGTKCFEFSYSGVLTENCLTVNANNLMCSRNGYAGGHFNGQTVQVIGGTYNENGGGNSINGYGVILNTWLNFAGESHGSAIGVTAINNYTRGIDSHAGFNLKAIGCQVEDTGQPNDAWGGQAYPDGFGLRFTRRIRRLVVMGNISSNDTSAGIMVDGAPGYDTVQDIVLSGNVVSGAGNYSMYIRPFRTTRLVISDNNLGLPSDASTLSLVISPRDSDGGWVDDLLVTNNTLPLGLEVTLATPAAATPGILVARLSGNSAGKGFRIWNNSETARITLDVDANTTKASVSGNLGVNTVASVHNNTIIGGQLSLGDGNLRSVASRNTFTPEGYTGQLLIGRTFGKIDANEFHSPIGSSILVTESGARDITNNRIIGSTASTDIRYVDSPGVNVYGNRAQSEAGTRSKVKYRADSGGRFFDIAFRSFEGRVEVDEGRGVFQMEFPQFHPDNFVGEFQVGDRAVNPAPVDFVEWVYTADGWKPFGVIPE